jgi:hypothetical protein
MALAQAGSIDVRDAFSHMHDLETAFYIADSSFWHVVQELASASASLITLDVQPSASGGLPHGMIALTGSGREMLLGTADRVTRCGLQRWLGGVRLEGREAMWRWDTADGHLVHE